MIDVDDDEYVPETRKESGNICCKSMTLLCLGIGLVVMLSQVIRYFTNPYNYQNDQSYIDYSIIFIFLIGFIVGFIVREVTKD